ncbi:E3 ubiquitin-protein ligase PRT6 [Mercurialis annua]|uniref:E3 ubiquitin-protein ligase PRT6 n=1 Tax=Mercurialis annua TaxID=3986 RepID=UPI00215FDD9F|nr:E3 ubiquitin-protein ligase PRT6 [Mercurialis annua]XP_050214283.1 E3 ubiquitin-protein ligase PRT6 [Mercurialis annua]XP_050214284.1 E3 ubiquitin-protein ligase PRT6 [Mercurialis annua]
MDNMDIDSPPEEHTAVISTATSLKPRDRVLRRLVQLGVGKEYLQKRYAGIVDFLMNNSPTRTHELVIAVLPHDDEVAEVMKENELGGSKKASSSSQSPTMKQYYRECMVWLQWMMFLGEPSLALKKLSKMSAERGVCGAVWGNNDIAYRCRTCEHDPTCAICVTCFQNGNHADHDYSIIYTGGGCCDCGDVTAWKREGFCTKHKGAEQIQPLPEEYSNSVGPVLDALFVCWKVKLASAEIIRRDNPRASDRAVLRKKAANELTFVVVEMLLEFCKHSESLLSFVSKKVISVIGLLEILVRAERFLSEGVSKKLNEILLKLLGEPIFKYEFGKVFLSYYPFVVHEAIKEGTDSVKKYPLLSTFSVQILTVPTLTPRLVKEMNLLSMLLGCMRDLFVHCAGEDGSLQVTKWGSLYETTMRVVEDIRFVMSHAVMLNYVTREQREILKTWMRLLSYLQGASPLKREKGIHIEEDNENINFLFVLDHSVANIHSLLVGGAFSTGEETGDEFCLGASKQDVNEEDSMRHAKVGRLSQESSVSGVPGRSNSATSPMQVAEVTSDSCQPLVPLSVTWLIYECLRAIDRWIGANHITGGLSSADTSTSSSSILALKRTFLNFRKGKSIFSGFTSSEEGQNRQLSPSTDSNLCMSTDVEITDSVQDYKRLVSGKMDNDKSDECLTEGNSSTESEMLRILGSSDWPNIVYDVSSEDVSVHIPLHRLLSSLLQKALKRCYSESEVLCTTDATTFTSLSSTYDDFFGSLLGGCHPCGFSAFIMEHPLRNRVFCAEVHAGMWRKNGDVAILSLEWYRSVRWSEQGLELDLFLLQCCAALAPADLYVNRILERFGLADYLSLNTEKSSDYEAVLLEEMLTLIIQIIQERRFSGSTADENLKRELIHKLSIGDATRSQLVKSLPRDLSKYDGFQEILDTVASYSNPSGFNQGMYSLRWMYWKELDLYHPRWNSRELQVAEERYMRYCNVSSLTTQLPRWKEIHPPLRGLARIATCEVVVKIVRAVLFYSVFSAKLTETRAPDSVLIMALHLLSLGLDICRQLRKRGEMLLSSDDSLPLLAFAVEEIYEGLSYSTGEQSLLSLLVLLMRIHKRENLDNFSESDGCNISSLIESLLKIFAELDSGCMAKLELLAPEVIIHLSQRSPNNDAKFVGSASDGEKRKEKARERQAAILAKMKAEQSKFLSSINSTADDSSELEVEESKNDDGQDIEESAQDVCSLCHDPKSKNPVAFLILLQKSRLLSLTQGGTPSWNQTLLSDKEQVSQTKKKGIKLAAINSYSSGLEENSSNELSHLVQNAVNEFADYAQPGEIINFLDFMRAQFPSLRNIQIPRPFKDGNDRAACTFETLEQDLYSSIRKEMNDNTIASSCRLDDMKFSANEGYLESNRRGGNSVLLGKYIAAFSREITEHPSSSDNSLDDIISIEPTLQVSTYENFGPTDCDGVYLCSCGHAVHQGCLDRYLSSLKERYSRRLVFEGGHIVDPDQGEFLCPVCRRLVNSVLPSLPGDFQKVWKEPMISKVSSEDSVGNIAALSDGSNSLRLPQALSLLQSAANMVEKGDIWKTFPLHRNEREKQNLVSVSRVLFKMYYPTKPDKFSRSTRANLFMIMWDTLKYSLSSMEIAARSNRTNLGPNYSDGALNRELRSSSGFVLSLLLKIVHSLRSKSSLHVLQRFRGIQLLARSICSGESTEHPSSPSGREGDLSTILRKVEKEVPSPDIQFWNQAADPILIHDAFSSLMWVIFCLPGPFLSCEESLLSLVRIFYIVSIVQAILSSFNSHQSINRETSFHDCLITDISKVLEESGWIQQYFVSKCINPNCDTMDLIRRMSLPYLRRCALLWKLLSTSVSEPFCSRDDEMNASSVPLNASEDAMDAHILELKEVQNLEMFFKIPPLDDVVKDQAVRSIAMKWLHHFEKEYKVFRSTHVLYSTPAVPFRLMQLPHVYQDLIERYIKQRCIGCKAVFEEPALCLLCGRLCSPRWKPCCRESACQTHAMGCGAGIGVYLSIKRTTILLQRCARQAPWPSPYLDAFGEEDIEMHRGKPLYLNEERYAALTYMVASHGLDRSSKVLGQTTLGSFFIV